MSSSLFAQDDDHDHSDVEFGYNNLAAPSEFDIEETGSTTDGFLFFESAMLELDPFDPGNFSANQPGFVTNGDEDLLINQGDQIFLNALNAADHSSFGKGFLNFYNPATGLLESAHAGRVGIYDNSGSTADLILNSGITPESGVTSQFIALGDADGDIHDHVIVDLLDDATALTGAYGVMFQLQSDFSTADGTMDLESDAFWLIFNHGMSESDFDSQALQAFGVAAVPEPGSACILTIGLASLVMRRRRRIA